MLSSPGSQWAPVPADLYLVATPLYQWQWRACPCPRAAARSVLLGWELPTQWCLWFTSCTVSRAHQAIGVTSGTGTEHEESACCPQEGEEVSDRQCADWGRFGTCRMSTLAALSPSVLAEHPLDRGQHFFLTHLSRPRPPARHPAEAPRATHLGPEEGTSGCHLTQCCHVTDEGSEAQTGDL